MSQTGLSNLKVLQAVLALTEQPIVLLDSRAQVMDFNSHAQQLYPNIRQEMPIETVLGHPMPELHAWLSNLGSETTEQSSFQFSASGNGSHVIWKCQKIASDQKAVDGFCLVGTDYTHRKRLEGDLQKSQRLIQDQKMALDESSIVAITDQRGVIRYVNDTFCRISGYSSDELIGKTHSVLKSGFHPPEFFQNLWTTIAQGRVWKGEIKNRAKDGSYYWVDTTIVPFLNEAGKPYQYVAIRNDITEKKQMQKNLEKEQLRTLHAEKMASLGELAAGIAHELGNPAAAINAWLDVVESQYERGLLDPELFIKMIPKVRREACRIRDIIRGMLAYARDGSRDPFQTENPYLLLNQVLENCSYKIKKSGVGVELDVSNQYLSVECRATEISQMLINLVLNCCDAIQNLDDKWVKVSILDQGDDVVYRVTDSGKGIPPEIAENMFNPFYTTKPVGKGTGLGLSIAKTIVENHQGQLFLDPSAEHTSFVVRLPKKQKSRA